MDSEETKKINYKILVVTIIFILGCGVSYYAGLKTQKTNNSNPDKTDGEFSQNGPGRMNGQRPNMGKVTAISSNSISIMSDIDGTTTTIAVTSETTVTDNGSDTSIDNIKVGDTVMVQTSSADTKTATRILLNPSFRGGSQDNDATSDSPSA